MSYLSSKISEAERACFWAACGPPEEVCKPDSVPPPRKREQQPFVWSPGCPRDRATDPREGGRATRTRPEGRAPSYAVLLRVGFTERPSSRTDLASSYLALSPLLRARGTERSTLCGTFPRLPGAAVSGPPALWSPDCPPAASASGCSTSSGAAHAPAFLTRWPPHPPAARTACAGSSDTGSAARCAG